MSATADAAPVPASAPGDGTGQFWHIVGSCRFEPGELDPYLPGIARPTLHSDQLAPHSRGIP
jgi:hypothetical protein